MNGTLERVAVLSDGRELQIERYIKRPIKEVWAAITEPDKLAHWLARAEIEPARGGRMRLHFENTNSDVLATITEFDPPYEFGYTWDEQKVPSLNDMPADAARLTRGDQCIQDLMRTRVLIRLAEQGEGTLMTLTHSLSERPLGARGGDEVNPAVVLAAWQNHIDGLNRGFITSFAGRPGETWAWGRFSVLQEKYQEAMGF